MDRPQAASAELDQICSKRENMPRDVREIMIEPALSKRTESEEQQGVNSAKDSLRVFVNRSRPFVTIAFYIATICTAMLSALNA